MKCANNYVINIENLTKKFGDRTILDNLSLKLKKGEFVAIVGSSGAGKSTLFNIIGLLDND